MVYLMKETPDPRTLKTALPDFSKTTHVFLPINDNPNPGVAEGGSHWSLLVVSLPDAVAFHYDSLLGVNQLEAEKVTRKFERLLARVMRFVQMQDAPQQENSSDCGVFVCLLMDYLLRKRLLMADSRSKVNMSIAGKEVDASGGRKKMVKVIDGYRREAKRRSS